MKSTILLNFDENTSKVEEEERFRFLKDLLDKMGVPVSEFWKTDTILSSDQKMKLREILAKWQIQVIEDIDGHMQIYVEQELTGEWFKPTYKLKRDLRELDPRKQFYIEMKIDTWTLFEGQQE
jgi:hypothetical protein